jgi:hypothetical protein
MPFTNHDLFHPDILEDLCLNQDSEWPEVVEIKSEPIQFTRVNPQEDTKPSITMINTEALKIIDTLAKLEPIPMFFFQNYKNDDSERKVPVLLDLPSVFITEILSYLSPKDRYSFSLMSRYTFDHFPAPYCDGFDLEALAEPTPQKLTNSNKSIDYFTPTSLQSDLLLQSDRYRLLDDNGKGMKSMGTENAKKECFFDINNVNINLLNVLNSCNNAMKRFHHISVLDKLFWSKLARLKSRNDFFSKNWQKNQFSENYPISNSQSPTRAIVLTIPDLPMYSTIGTALWEQNTPENHKKSQKNQQKNHINHSQDLLMTLFYQSLVLFPLSNSAPEFTLAEYCDEVIFSGEDCSAEKHKNDILEEKMSNFSPFLPELSSFSQQEILLNYILTHLLSIFHQKPFKEVDLSLHSLNPQCTQPYSLNSSLTSSPTSTSTSVPSNTSTPSGTNCQFVNCKKITLDQQSFLPTLYLSESTFPIITSPPQITSSLNGGPSFTRQICPILDKISTIFPNLKEFHLIFPIKWDNTVMIEYYDSKLVHMNKILKNVLFNISFREENIKNYRIEQILPKQIFESFFEHKFDLIILENMNGGDIFPFWLQFFDRFLRFPQHFQLTSDACNESYKLSDVKSPHLFNETGFIIHTAHLQLINCHFSLPELTHLLLHFSPQYLISIHINNLNITEYPLNIPYPPINNVEQIQFGDLTPFFSFIFSYFFNMKEFVFSIFNLSSSRTSPLLPRFIWALDSLLYGGNTHCSSKLTSLQVLGVDIVWCGGNFPDKPDNIGSDQDSQGYDRNSSTYSDFSRYILKSSALIQELINLCFSKMILYDEDDDERDTKSMNIDIQTRFSILHELKLLTGCNDSNYYNCTCDYE